MFRNAFLSASFILQLVFVSTAVSGQESDSPSNSQLPVLLFDGPGSTPAALYVQSLLEQVYLQLGYQVQYSRVPLARSFVEANAGRLDGLRARVKDAASEYPNLILVPTPLLEFEIISIADRRRCGLCDSDWLNTVVTTQGFKALEDLLSQSKWNWHVEYVARQTQAINMVLQGKVDAAIISDVNLPEDYTQLNVHWVKNSLAVYRDYHFVNKKHRLLVPKIVQILEQMEQDGRLADLRKQYGLSPVSTESPTMNFEKIRASTASWVGFTDTEAGTYRRILKQLYAPYSNLVEFEIVNWKRAKQLFATGKVDMLVGAYSDEMPENSIPSVSHIDYEVPVIAVARNQTILKRLQNQDASISVCYILGYDFNRSLTSNVKPYEVQDMADCERLLKNDRVDVMLDYALDIPPSLLETYPNMEIMESLPLFILFHDNDRGRALKGIFDEQFKIMVKDGTVQSLFPDKEQFINANLVPLQSN